MAYWFMRMKQGSKGRNLAPELWNEGLVGVLFGTWTLDEVLTDGTLDKAKVTFERLKEYPPQGEPVFKKEWLDSSRRFLIEMSDGDRVVVEFDGSLHLATVTDHFERDPDPSTRNYGEQFKCRRIRDPRPPFPLENLPSSYRLISGIGRGTVQRVKAYKPHVELLDRCGSSQEVTEAFSKMSTGELLEMLSPEQWEVLCSEYLRSTKGVRPLLLAVGSTLKDIDIYGATRDGVRVLAQCKNDATPRRAQTVDEWEYGLVESSEDILYFFARGGVKGHKEGRCTVVDGEEILRWLESQEDYERHLKTL